MKKVIYICGRFSLKDDSTKTEFLEIQKKLIENDFDVINIHQLFSNIDTTGFTDSDVLKYRFVALLNSDLVITLPDLYDDKQACREISLAHETGIKVVASVTFFSNEK